MHQGATRAVYLLSINSAQRDKRYWLIRALSGQEFLKKLKGLLPGKMNGIDSHSKDGGHNSEKRCKSFAIGVAKGMDENKIRSWFKK